MTPAGVIVIGMGRPVSRPTAARGSPRYRKASACSLWSWSTWSRISLAYRKRRSQYGHWCGCSSSRITLTSSSLVALTGERCKGRRSRLARPITGRRIGTGPTEVPSPPRRSAPGSSPARSPRRPDEGGRARCRRVGHHDGHAGDGERPDTAVGARAGGRAIDPGAGRERPLPGRLPAPGFPGRHQRPGRGPRGRRPRDRRRPGPSPPQRPRGRSSRDRLRAAACSA